MDKTTIQSSSITWELKLWYRPSSRLCIVDRIRSLASLPYTVRARETVAEHISKHIRVFAQNVFSFAKLSWGISLVYLNNNPAYAISWDALKKTQLRQHFSFLFSQTHLLKLKGCVAAFIVFTSLNHDGNDSDDDSDDSDNESNDRHVLHDVNQPHLLHKFGCVDRYSPRRYCSIIGKMVVEWRR